MIKINKKAFLLTIALFISFFIGTNVDALSMARVTNTTGTYIWSGPGYNHTKKAFLYYNDIAPITSTIKVPTTNGCSAGWYEVDYNGTTGYICSLYVSTSGITARINSDGGMNLRNGAGTNYSKFGTIENDTMVTLVNSTKYKGTGCSKGWYKLSYNTYASKYACANYIDSYNANTTAIVTTRSGSLVRTSPNSTTSIATLKYNQAVTLYGTTKYKGYNCSGKYYKVYYQGKVRYVCSNSLLTTNHNATINNLAGVKVWTGPGRDYDSIGTFKYNYNVSLLSTTKYKGLGCGSGYYKIKVTGYTRYICSALVSTSSLSTTTTDQVNARSGAGTNYSTTTTIPKNTNVILLSETKYKGTGCTDGWLKISLNSGTSYICSTYTKLNPKANVTTPNQNQNTTTNNNTTTTTPPANTTTNKNKTVTKVSLNSSIGYYTTNKWTYKINEDYATVRKTAGGAVQEYIYLGTEVKPLSTSGQYTKISYYNGKTGWIFTRLIDEYSKVTKQDTSYCTKLKNEGFPESYCPALSYLHSKYPNWTFKAEKTGDTFKNAVINESKKNYTQAKQSEYLYSSKIVEAPDWKVASDSYMAYLLDPRNYLNEKNIFAFEDLSYNSSYHTKATVRDVLDGTYLDTDTYASYFVNAGKTYKVSPIHLASRVKQEGGSNSTYAPVSGTVTSTWKLSETGYLCSVYAPLVNGNPVVKSGYNLVLFNAPNVNNAGYKYANGTTIRVNSSDTLTLATTKTYTGNGCSGAWYKVNVYKSLKGYYNYYNIGAYGDNPTLRGLAAAAGYVDDLEGTPWDTRQKAITYGAKFIAEGYINKGQDTLFYQKFNVGPKTTNKYTHQYMTNIIAPANESLSTYYLYNSTNYVFKIPVFDEMPKDFTSHPPVENIEKHLNTLK